MSPKPIPPLPPGPGYGDKPRTTGWSLVLAGIGFLFILGMLSILTLNTFSPVVLLGTVFFLLIGVQYFVWGWWFERIYRRGREDLEE